MHSFRPLLTAAVLSIALPISAHSASAAEPVGTLKCNVAGGVGFVITSSKALACTFESGYGTEYYVGTIRRFGLQVGITGPGCLVWGVLAADAKPGPVALSGEYLGASASVSVGPGVGANALVGGNNQSIVLQPVSVNAQTGVDLAAGVGDLILEAAEPPH